MLPCERLDLLIVDLPGQVVEPIGHDVVQATGEVDRRTVGQMTAVGEAHAEHRVAGLQQRHVDGRVGL